MALFVDIDKCIWSATPTKSKTLSPELQLATNLRDATRDFKASPDASPDAGPEFVEHFTCSREYKRHVNDWQLRRYFELI